MRRQSISEAPISRIISPLYHVINVCQMIKGSEHVRDSRYGFASLFTFHNNG